MYGLTQIRRSCITATSSMKKHPFFNTTADQAAMLVATGYLIEFDFPPHGPEMLPPADMNNSSDDESVESENLLSQSPFGGALQDDDNGSDADNEDTTMDEDVAESKSPKERAVTTETSRAPYPTPKTPTKESQRDQ